MCQKIGHTLSVQSTTLAQLQEKAATGQEVNRVSDDPSSANRILSLLKNKQILTQYTKNISGLTSVLELSSSVLQSMTSQVSDARADIESLINGTVSDSTRTSLADGLDDVIETLVSLANTQQSGQSLFGGSNSSTAPYRIEYNSDGDISRVVYQGGTQENMVDVADGVSISALLSGPSLFTDDDPQTPVFYGSTGAAVGAGSSTVRGNVSLQVQGSVGNWQLSIDGGANWVSSNGTEANLAVVNSETGETLYVDTANIIQAGTEPVSVPGTYDIFNALINAKDLLKNAQNIPDTQLNNILNDTVRGLEGADEVLTRSFSIVGGKLQILSSLGESIEQIQTCTEDNIGQLQDADVSQLAIDLSQYEVLYQMSLAVAQKMFSMSFLDFMS
jgi:flagellar hook-associated protein 3 FlgL